WARAWRPADPRAGRPARPVSSWSCLLPEQPNHGAHGTADWPLVRARSDESVGSPPGRTTSAARRKIGRRSQRGEGSQGGGENGEGEENRLLSPLFSLPPSSPRPPRLPVLPSPRSAPGAKQGGQHEPQQQRAGE